MLHPLAVTLHLSFLPPLAAATLLSVRVDLPLLDILYERRHTVCSLLRLASFT